MKIGLRHVITALIVGMLLGVVGMVKLAPRHFGGRWGDPQKFQRHIMQTFTQKLSLNAEQQAQISAIMEETRAQMETLRAEMKPKFRQIRSQAQVKIRQILEPAQQQKFDVLVAQQEARFKERRGGHHGQRM
ncbi:MAG: periplasmic heavy metal sensor [Candidatus Omnitrophota bacterium]